MVKGAEALSSVFMFSIFRLIIVVIDILKVIVTSYLQEETHADMGFARAGTYHTRK